MTRRRLLTLGCRVAVVFWGVVALGLNKHPEAPDVTSPASDSRATITARPEAAAPPSAPPAAPDLPREPAEAAAAAARSIAPIPVSRADVEDGRTLLSGAGSFPALSCSYEDFPGFLEYARAMQGLGARFVVVRDRSIVGGVDLATSRVVAAPEAGDFSPRARDYAGEPALEPLASAVRDAHGAGAEVMLLVPRRIDAGLFGAVARALAERGEHQDGYREFRGRYLRAPGSQLRLSVDRGIRHDGSSVALGWTFDLAAVPQ